VAGVVRVAAVTGRGRVRPANEDAVLALGWLSQSHRPMPVVIEAGLAPNATFAVADGLGGHAAGATASWLALNELAARSGEWADAQAVRDGLEQINQAVHAASLDDPRLRGMATTIAGVIVTPEEVWCFNVGDSRIYRITDGYPEQISQDDSLLDGSGEPTNIVTQVLGGSQEDPLVPHLTTLPTEPTRFLLCSDGVTGPIGREDFRVICRQPDLVALMRQLFDAAYEAGAPDNVSILALDIWPEPVENSGEVPA